MWQASGGAIYGAARSTGVLLRVLSATSHVFGTSVTGLSRMPSETVSQSVDSVALTDAYRRLAAMDPPALRSLIVELSRISHESSALARRRGTPDASARAARDAQRAAAAQAALDSAEAAEIL